MYYRIAIQGDRLAHWRWKSSLLNSLHPVLGILKLYHCLPKDQIRVFLATTSEHMDKMLSRANQGLLSTAITVDQLYDTHRISWIEVRRLEIELGPGGSHDQPYIRSLPSSSVQVLAWTKLRALCERGELVP